MSPIAIFLSLSELGMSSHPRAVFLGTSFPSQNFTEPDLQDPHSWPAQPCCSVSCYLGKLWGRIMTVGTSLPLIQFGCDRTEQVVEDRVCEGTIERKNTTTAGFQQYQPWRKKHSCYQLPMAFRTWPLLSISHQVPKHQSMTSYLFLGITKAVWRVL